MPLLVLRQMYSLGYQRQQWKEIKKVVSMARRSADPAIDFVGEGGALPPLKTEPPQSLQEALQELRELKWRRERNKQFEDEAEELRIAYLLLLIKKVSEKVAAESEEPIQIQRETKKEEERKEEHLMKEKNAEQDEEDEAEEETGEGHLQKSNVHARLVAVANKLAKSSSPADLHFKPTRC